MRRIELGKSARKHCTLYAVVDDADYLELVEYRWYAKWNKDTRSYYAVRNTRNAEGRPVKVYMHLQILKPTEKYIGDHINHDTLDNRRSNLRELTPTQSTLNRRRRKHTTSQYQGVYWNRRRKKWHSRISKTTGGQRRFWHIGYYENEEEAALAYDEAAKALFGKDAYQNFP